MGFDGLDAGVDILDNLANLSLGLWNVAYFYEVEEIVQTGIARDIIKAKMVQPLGDITLLLEIFSLNLSEGGFPNWEIRSLFIAFSFFMVLHSTYDFGKVQYFLFITLPLPSSLFQHLRSVRHKLLCS